MTTEKTANPQDKAKEDEKQLKKLLDSYTTVAAHKLGRPPTLDDLTKMLTENAGQEEMPGAKAAPTPVTSQPVAQRGMDQTSDTTPKQPAQGTQASPTASPQNPQPMDKAAPAGEGMDADPDGEPPPNIAKMTVYYGMGEGEPRQPDPGNILFYKHPDGRFYDTNAQDWSDVEPPMARHLPSRPIRFNEQDIVAAIAHGVMDDTDYEQLDKAQMIGHNPRLLWEKVKKLHGLYSDLQKSSEIEAEAEVDTDLLPGEPSGGAGVNAVGQFLSTAGVEPSDTAQEAGGDLAGEDLVKQIVDAACAAVGESPELEEKIRRIVKEELAAAGLGGEDLQAEETPDSMTEI